MIFYRVCIHEYFQLVLCSEVCPLSECPLLEVSLYILLAYSLGKLDPREIEFLIKSIKKVYVYTLLKATNMCKSLQQ